MPSTPPSNRRAPRSSPHASMPPATSNNSMRYVSCDRSPVHCPTGQRGAPMPANAKQTVFGIAMRNFTKYPEMPNARALIEYGVRMEELGYESLWAWDHILLGVDPNFPIHEALALLTAVAARTTKIKVGTGILVMPVRNPVILAKELATIDHISNGRLLVGAAVGWYKREFDSLGVDFSKRGKIMEQSLEII